MSEVTDALPPHDPQPRAQRTPLTFDGDRAQLRGTLWQPLAREPRAGCVIHAATAVPTGLYDAFASYLTGRGFAVLSYAYRGTGQPGEAARHPGARVRDWALGDAPAATAELARLFPGLPLVAVGHSLGGQTLVLGSGGGRLRAQAIVASHLAVTAKIPDPGERRQVAMLLDEALPMLADQHGYVPGALSGLGEDLPVGAAREWGAWSRLPNYFYDVPELRARARAAELSGPVLAIGVSDDPWATPEQLTALLAPATGAELTRWTVTPADAAVPSVGHFGYFRRRVGAVAWPELADWLIARLGEPGQ